MIAAALILLLMQASPPPLTAEAIRAEPGPSVAARVIGPEEAADVERAEVRWDRMLPGGAELRLFHRPVPFGEDMCRRRVHVVSLLTLDPVGQASLPRDLQSLRVTHVHDSETIAMAPGCRAVPGQSFVHVNTGLAPAVVAQGLRELAAARAAAAGSGRLPFRLSCRDEAPDRRDACSAGARRTLAALPTERAWMMNGRADGIEFVIGEPGQLQWRVAMARLGTRGARVSMIWFMPAPF